MSKLTFYIGFHNAKNKVDMPEFQEEEIFEIDMELKEAMKLLRCLKFTFNNLTGMKKLAWRNKGGT